MPIKNENFAPRLTFHVGWKLLYHRLQFMLGWGGYLFRRRDFPLFKIFPLKTGALYTMKVVHDIGIRKLVQFGDLYFSSLTLPHHPSPAFDRALARGGLNVGAAGTPLKLQIDTVLLAITRRCDLHCQHCYERHNIGGGEEIPVERLRQVISQVQQQGVSTLVLTGGEPMNRFDDLLSLVGSANKNLSDLHMHTSGHGVTLERAVALKKAGLIAAAVGLDDVDPVRHDDLRGFKGSHEEAVRALGVFRSAGVFTYVNCCATPAMVRSGDLWRYAEFVRDLGVAFIQLLEPRPCGGYLNTPDGALLRDDDRRQLVDFFRQMNTRKQYRHYPIVHYVAYAESPAQRGCMMGGLSHLYVDSHGNVNPCVFLPVTFGNITDEDFEPIYLRMREAIPRPLHQECPALQLHTTLRKQADSIGGMPVPHPAIKGEWDTMFRKEEE
jgi:MoaA/NifB/PqqE/SkfB family radical SAM enzyme